MLDLGCGTGWLLDHLHPASYVGVDASSAMLATLRDKHPWTSVVKATVGEPGWTKAIVEEVGLLRFDVVTATWAAHEFGDLSPVLTALRSVVLPGGVVVLHGQSPRYDHRPHYVLPDDERRGYRHFTPRACEIAARVARVRVVGCWGTGACPDMLARHRAMWRPFVALPARMHYAFAVAFAL